MKEKQRKQHKESANVRASSLRRQTRSINTSPREEKKEREPRLVESELDREPLQQKFRIF